MNELLEYLDIIVLIIMVLVLFILFRRVLGKKVGFEKPKIMIDPIDIENLEKDIQKELGKSANVLNVYPEGSLKYNLSKLKENDNSFSEKEFIEKAKKAFTLISTNFNNYNLDDIKSFISEGIYNTFKTNIESLKAQNKVIYFKLEDFLISDVYNVSFENDTAFLKVKFVTRQIRKILNKDDFSSSFTANDSSIFSDVWIFSKNMKDNVSIWKLVNILGA